MSRTSFAILMIAIAAAVLLLMWLAWRGRRRRDSAIVVSTTSAAEIASDRRLASFADVPYVSTTPVGSPFERIAIPGLDYKGPADLVVTASGVMISVAGAPEVALPVAQLRGTGTANGRVGKIVERDGLSLLRWVPAAAPGPEREFESAFRFTDPAQQQRFAAAIVSLDEAAPRTHSASPVAPQDAERPDTATQRENAAHTTQEDA